MMEKRNFVTPARVSGCSVADELADATSCMFGTTNKKAKDTFEKIASAEDEKSDRE